MAASRRFRIWQDSEQCWRWECTFCSPPAHGGRFGPDAWRKIIEISMRGHMRRRYCHHRWVAQHGGWQHGNKR